MANVLHVDSTHIAGTGATGAVLTSPAITTTQQRVMLVMTITVGSSSGNFPPDIFDTDITGAGLTWHSLGLVHELQSTRCAEVIYFYAITNKILTSQTFAIATETNPPSDATIAIAQVTGFAEPVASTITGSANYFNGSVAAAADCGTVTPPYTVNLRFGATVWCQGGATPTFNASGWTSMWTPTSSFAQSTAGYIVSSTTTGYHSGGTANAWAAGDLALKMTSAYGTVTTSLTKASMSASGTVGAGGESGTIVTSLASLSQSAGGTVSPAGTINTALSRLSMSASGDAAQEFGTITTHLGSGISQSAQGAIAEFVGHITTSLSPFSQGLVGEEIVVGDVVTSLDNQLGMQASGVAVEEFIGSIVTNLRPISASLEAQEIFVADATTALFPFAQSMGGEVLIEGSIYTQLGRAGQFMTTFVEALEIIEGPIVTNLAGIQTHALGGPRAAPGTGVWYSWRSPDS